MGIIVGITGIKDIILTKRKGTHYETNIDRNGCVDNDVACVWG
jgi:hypothetical protein